MDSIVNKLKESRDIEVAKSILEDQGYKVSKRLKESVAKGKWEKFEAYPDCTALSYEVDNSNFTGGVYPPDCEDQGYYSTVIITNDSHVEGPNFDTEEEAKRWVEEWFEKEYPKYKEPHRGMYSTSNQKAEYAIKLLDRAINSGDADEAWKLIDFLHDTEILEELL